MIVPVSCARIARIIVMMIPWIMSGACQIFHDSSAVIVFEERLYWVHVGNRLHIARLSDCAGIN